MKTNFFFIIRVCLMGIFGLLLCNIYTPSAQAQSVVSNDDTFYLEEGQTTDVTAWANDIIPPISEGSLSIDFHSFTQFGTLTYSIAGIEQFVIEAGISMPFEVLAEGTLSYTPNAGSIGNTENIPYVLMHDLGVDTALLQIHIINASTMPLPQNDNLVVDMNTALSYPILQNDSDPQAIPFSLSSFITTPQNGTLSLNATEDTITYTPNLDFIGTDNFVYEICNMLGLCAQATVQIQVFDPATAPLINDDNLIAYETQAASINLFSNDSDPNGLALSFQYPPDFSNSEGTVVSSPDGTYTYTANLGFTGTKTFSYYACNTNGQCKSAYIYITVLPDAIESAPVAIDDTVITSENTPIIVSTLYNDYDPDGDALIAPDFTFSPSNGTIAINGNNTFTYTPSPNFSGIDSFGYMIFDPLLNSDEGTVYINVLHNNSLENDMVYTAKNTPVDIYVFQNDSIMLFGNVPSGYTQPNNGTLILDVSQLATDGAAFFVYTPNVDFIGIDSFVYYYNNDTALVHINVIESIDNIAPVAVDDYEITSGNTPIIVSTLGNDYDPLGNPITIAYTTFLPTNGTLMLNGDNTFMYTPNPGFAGIDSFGYVVDNGILVSNEAIVTITVINNGIAYAFDDYVATASNVAVTFEPLANDYDSEGLGLILNTISQPSNGTLVVGADNSITYTPNTDFIGQEVLTYIVTSATGIFDTALVYITIFDNDCTDNNCVYPGDANNDGIANNLDVLALGLGYGNTGVVRPFANATWIGQPCVDWAQTMTQTDPLGNSITFNAKHSDCDGNGVVEATDTLYISQNYGYWHSKDEATNAGESAVTLQMPTEIVQGQFVSVPIVWGNADNPIADQYGLAFTIQYPVNLVQPGTFYISYDADSWLANDADNLLTFSKSITDAGQLHAAITRTNQTPQSGYGVLAHLNFYVVDNIVDKGESTGNIPFSLYINNITAIDSSGTIDRIGNHEANVDIVSSFTTTPIAQNDITLSPNPSNYWTTLHLGKYIANSIEICNMIGQTVYKASGNITDKYTIYSENLQNGYYMVRVYTDKGVHSTKMLVWH